MKVIIAGSRKVAAFHHVRTAVKNAGFNITEVVCGMAQGADLLGRSWAIGEGIPVKEMPADWRNLDVPNCVPKRNKAGHLYNALAGHNRNQEMVDYADAAIFLWDGYSTGTKDCMDRATAKGIPIHLYRIPSGW